MIVTRTAEIRKNKEGGHEFVISTEAADSYGTVFKADGWHLERYNRNPVISFNHSTHDSDPDVAVIGTSEVRREGNSLVAIPFFEEGNPVADKVKRKIDNGTLKMASIGAEVREHRRGIKSDGEDPDLIYFTNQDLIEWSIVPVGANPDAHKRSLEQAIELKKEDTKDEPTGMSPETADKLREWDRIKIELIK